MKNSPQLVPCQPKASRCGSQSSTRDVDENGAATSRHPRSRVMIDLDDQVIEVVRPPEAIAVHIGPCTKRTIIPAVGGRFAPGVVAMNWTYRQQSTRACQAIGAPPQPDQTKTAAWRSGISFPFVRSDASASKCYRKVQRSDREPSLPPVSGSGTNKNERKCDPAH